MIYEYPEDIENFACIAGDCPDTCCAGWEVDLDEDTCALYRETAGPFGDRLRAAIHEEDGYTFFPLTEENRCPFLDKRGLCEIYRELGPTSLSVTCDEYPRYYLQVGDYEQIDMSLSCMEYARIYFASERRTLHRMQDEMISDEDCDETRLLAILDLRDRILDILQSGEGSFDSRFQKTLELCGMTAAETDPALQERMERAEILDERWEGKLALVRSYLEEEKNVPAAVSDIKGLPGDTDRWLTKTAVYFFFRYMIDAYYDEDKSRLGRLVSRSIRYTVLLLAAEVHKRNGEAAFDQDDFVEMIHLISRQIEHCEENVDLLKDAGL